jgi:hypothetical protein
MRTERYVVRDARCSRYARCPVDFAPSTDCSRAGLRSEADSSADTLNATARHDAKRVVRQSAYAPQANGGSSYVHCGGLRA